MGNNHHGPYDAVHEYICEGCGKTDLAKFTTRRFCSSKCAMRMWRIRKILREHDRNPAHLLATVRPSHGASAVDRVPWDKDED
jgi:hypothetical protein